MRSGVTEPKSLATAPLTALPRIARQTPAPAPSVSTMGRSTVSQQQPPPTLKKKRSFRDRFRGPVQDAPSPEPEPEKQRVAYVPKHAAADFLRLPSSQRPSSKQQQLHSYDEPSSVPQQVPKALVPVVAHSTEDESQNAAVSKHYSPRALETLDENEPVQVTSVQVRVIHHGPKTDEPQVGVSSPTSSHQQCPGPAEIVEVGRPSSNQTTGTYEEEQMVTPPADATAQQLSDYELFLARAEERERSYRGHLLRTLSQRQYSQPEPNPYFYHNSETRTADSAVVAEASGPRRKGWEGRLSGLDSGIGSKNSSQMDGGSRLQSEEPTTRVSNTWERGHRKHASWTPSFGAGGNDADRGLAVPELDEGGYTTSHAPFAEMGYSAQPPRTLKKQISIKQKLGAYIKPARPPSRYEEPELRRGNNKRVAEV